MNKIRAVVADDNSEMLATLMEMLAEVFDVIQAVDNGQAALDAVMQLKPEIAIFDISMPLLNGLEVAWRLKDAADHYTKIVFLTLHSDPDTVAAAVEAGALGYVLKPRMQSDLMSAIHFALQGNRFVSPGMSNISGSFSEPESIVPATLVLEPLGVGELKTQDTLEASTTL